MGNAPTEPLASREAIEAMILDEERDLVRIVGLLDAGTPFAQWPEKLHLALSAALYGGEGPGEALKAEVLARHLFRSTRGLAAAPPDTLAAPLHRLAERLRADLPGLTRLGAGCRCGVLAPNR